MEQSELLGMHGGGMSSGSGSLENRGLPISQLPAVNIFASKEMQAIARLESCQRQALYTVRAQAGSRIGLLGGTNGGTLMI